MFDNIGGSILGNMQTGNAKSGMEDFFDEAYKKAFKKHYLEQEVSEKDAAQIAKKLSDGNAKNDQSALEKIGIKAEKGSYADNDLSKAIVERAKGGFTQAELDEVREMAKATKDGKSEHILNSTKGENYKKGVELASVTFEDVKAPAAASKSEKAPHSLG